MYSQVEYKVITLRKSIEIKKFSFKYEGDKKCVLDTSCGINLQSGKITVVVGRSGVGKTTLLKLQAGLLDSRSGYEQNLGIRKAIVFQTPTLLPWKTVWSNCLLDQIVNPGLHNDESKQLVERYLKKFSLWDKKNAYPRSLSGGMRQRVSIIQALVSQPDLLLLDEPFANLDSLLKREFLIELDKYCGASNCATILVTHDLDDAVRIADEIIVLAGSPADISQVIKLKSSRLDRLSVNLQAEQEVVKLRELLINSLRA